MSSLRSRLTLGSALIAVIPLAATMLLLSQQIGAMVRSQAAERLNAALDGLQAQLQVEGEKIDSQLRAVGNDASLRRLVLVHRGASLDLIYELSEKRMLLGLDFLQVVEQGGRLIGSVSGGDSDAPAMGSSAPMLYENAPVATVRGGRWLDKAFLGRLKETSGVELVLRDAAGVARAATLAGAPEVPGTLGSEVVRVDVGGRGYLARSRALDISGARGVRVTGLVSTAAADQAIATLRATAILLGVAGLVMAILLGALWSSQVSRPVETLAAFSRRVSQGEWEEPLVLDSVRELDTLVEALERMRRDLRTYRERLVVSERQAAWSYMARTVAHEVKNPLTPIAISIADLQRSYEQRRPDFPHILEQAVRTVGEEIESLKRMLQEFSDFARLPAPRPAPCSVSELLGDLEVLYARDVAEHRMTFVHPRPDVTVFADAGQLKRALINLIKNGLEALSGPGRVAVSAAGNRDEVEISVSDTGPGLTTEQRARLFAPGFTTKTAGSGLGLTIVERIVSDHGGTIDVEPGPEGGTRVRIRLALERRT